VRVLPTNFIECKGCGDHVCAGCAAGLCHECQIREDQYISRLKELLEECVFNSEAELKAATNRICELEDLLNSKSPPEESHANNIRWQLLLLAAIWISFFIYAPSVVATNHGRAAGYRWIWEISGNEQVDYPRVLLEFLLSGLFLYAAIIYKPAKRAA
jgi:hypothetical protein